MVYVPVGNTYMVMAYVKQPYTMPSVLKKSFVFQVLRTGIVNRDSVLSLFNAIIY